MSLFGGRRREGDLGRAGGASGATAGHKGAPASQASTCATLVSETTAACRDWIERGLDVNCYGKLIAIEGHRRESAGNLLEGDMRSCSTQLDSLRQQRAKKDAAMRPEGSTGPECKALSTELQSRCFEGLGNEKLSGNCKMTMMMLRRAKATEPDARCAFAAGMLKQTGP